MSVFMNTYILNNIFNKIRDNRINFDDVLKRQNEFLIKLRNAKIGKKKTKNKLISKKNN